MKKNFLLVSMLAIFLTACSNPVIKQDFPLNDIDDVRAKREGKLTGKEGIVLFGGKKKYSSGEATNSINVNRPLWNEALKVISFMPLLSADSAGGTILTDWYEDPLTPGERFKCTIIFNGKRLSTDAIDVRLFKQTRHAKSNEWKDALIDHSMAEAIKDRILINARETKARLAAQPS